MRRPRTAMKRSPGSPQPEKAGAKTQTNRKISKNFLKKYHSAYIKKVLTHEIKVNTKI